MLLVEYFRSIRLGGCTAPYDAHALQVKYNGVPGYSSEISKSMLLLKQPYAVKT